MKSCENIDVKSVKEAVRLLEKFQQEKKTTAVVGGGSEYLQLMKDHVVEPDYLINLKTIPGLDYIKEERGHFVSAPSPTSPTLKCIRRSKRNC